MIGKLWNLQKLRYFKKGNMKVTIFDLDFGYRKAISFRNGSGEIFNFKNNSWEKVDEGVVLDSKKYCIILNDEMYATLAEKIRNDNRIPLKEKAYVEGKLEATENHLKDLQKIVFKD